METLNGTNTGPSAGPQFNEEPVATKDKDIDELTPTLQGGPTILTPDQDHDAGLDADDD